MQLDQDSRNFGFLGNFWSRLQLRDGITLDHRQRHMRQSRWFLVAGIHRRRPKPTDRFRVRQNQAARQGVEIGEHRPGLSELN